MKVRAVAFGLLLFSLSVTVWMLNTWAYPEIGTSLALGQVNDPDGKASIALRVWQGAPELAIMLAVSVAIVGVVLFLPELRQLWSRLRAAVYSKYLDPYKGQKSRINPLIAVALFTVLAHGCGPAELPVYVSVESNETAFVVPLEGDQGRQVKFDSADALNQYKVATKRLQVPLRKSSTGRMWYSYEFIPTVRVIKVSRTPITQSWSSPTATAGNGIWVESSDSIGFSTGFTITAMITEEDTALFLYKYPGSSLDKVMEQEIRGRVQANMAEVAARYPMDKLRERKQEMTELIRADLLPFFKARGITITTVGNFGGFTYENSKIQEAIDNVFVAQQEKNVAAALLTAQKDKNQKLLEEGQGEASKVKEIAKGRAEAVETEARAQAKAIVDVAEATKKAGSDPVFIQIKQLEVQQEQIKKWDGRFPQFMMGTGGSPMLMLQMPAAAPQP
jgi:hypothetical protein